MGQRGGRRSMACTQPTSPPAGSGEVALHAEGDVAAAPCPGPDVAPPNAEGMEALAHPVDAQAALRHFVESLSYVPPETTSLTHLQWLEREAVKLMHREFDLARREHLFQATQVSGAVRSPPTAPGAKTFQQRGKRHDRKRGGQKQAPNHGVATEAS